MNGDVELLMLIDVYPKSVMSSFFTEEKRERALLAAAVFHITEFHSTNRKLKKRDRSPIIVGE
jgi:hypothetical protein